MFGSEVLTKTKAINIANGSFDSEMRPFVAIGILFVD
jgi:hypothetical protein